MYFIFKFFNQVNNFLSTFIEIKLKKTLKMSKVYTCKKNQVIFKIVLDLLFLVFFEKYWDHV